MGSCEGLAPAGGVTASLQLPPLSSSEVRLLFRLLVLRSSATRERVSAGFDLFELSEQFLFSGEDG